MTAAAFQIKKAAYPLRFAPQYKDYLWGGDHIPRHFNRPLPPGIYAESWEASIRPEGLSVVTNGPLAGTPLSDLYPDFPLLLKILDARDTLSIQVHPDETAARIHGGEPKTEAWHILATDPGACVYCGLKPGTDESAVRRALAENRVGELMVKIPVTAGDTIYVPGGTVHAIGAGCLLLECQQNSNTTYRLFDWNRPGPDGKPRELHIEQALRCINWNGTAHGKIAPQNIGLGRTNLVRAPYFQIDRLDLSASATQTIETGSKPEILFIASGALTLTDNDFSETAPAGTTYLLPPNRNSIVLAPRTTAIALRISIP